jgi:hypothetical protein
MCSEISSYEAMKKAMDLQNLKRLYFYNMINGWARSKKVSLRGRDDKIQNMCANF